MKTLMEFGFVAFGGALGAMSRYGIALAIERFFKSQLPIATLLANVGGCLLMGVLIGSEIGVKSPSIKLMFGVGFLGALTTFSTFGAETQKHIETGNLGVATGNVLINVSFCLVAVFLGIVLAKRLLGT